MNGQRYALAWWWRLLFLLGLALAGCGNRQATEPQEAEAGEALLRLEELFQRGRSHQSKGEYKEAIAAYEDCIALEVPDREADGRTINLLSNALTQLMNSHQSNGTPEQCADYFLRQIDSSSHFVRRYCERDLHVVAAYALSRTERMEQAEELMQGAFMRSLIEPTPERRFRDYAYAAAIFYPNPERHELIISCAEQALEQAKLCKNNSGVEWVNSLLGNHYRRIGAFNKAIQLYLNSANEAHRRNDPTAEVMANTSLAELYLTCQIADYAEIYATNALTAMRGRRINPMVATQAYLTKGEVEVALNRVDSALRVFRQAEQICRDLPYNSGQVDVDRLMGEQLIAMESRDSIRRGVAYLKRVIERGTTTNRARAYHDLAMVCERLGEREHIGRLLDSMEVLRQCTDPPLEIELNYGFILNHYLRQRDWRRVAAYAIEQSGSSERANDKQLIKRLYETIVEYQTRQQESELQQARRESQRHRLYLYLGVTITLLLLALLTMLTIYHRKLHRANQLLLESRLTELFTRLESEKSEKAQIEQRLSSLLANGRSRREIEALSPALIREEGEAEFRQRFVMLFPLFLGALRKRIPTVGPREELLCMLIALGQDNEQISTLMGISRSSVVMARHRLRQKLNLDKSDSLEQQIEALKGE